MRVSLATHGFPAARSAWLVAALAVLAPALPAQAAAPATAFDPRNLSGFWELPYDGRNIPPAKLQASVTPAVLAEHAAQDANTRRWCYFMGMPMAMESPRPIDIRQSAHEVLVNFETRATPRHIYLDRKENMVLDDYDFTSTGDSVGHWEGNTFVVTTVGIDGSKGLTLLPGGGFRTTDSRLTESFRLANNGNALLVTFTWEDPKVFTAPHTYAYRYTRAPKFYEVQAPLDCDPLDKERAAFFADPLSGH
jgi:hypothetical protein